MDTALASYLQRVRPAKYSILGNVLLPFSLGHYFHAAEFGLSLTADNATLLSVDDLKHPRWWTELTVAMAICRNRYEDFETIQTDVDLWNAEFSTVNKTIAECYTSKFFNPLVEVHNFQQYVKEGFNIPFWNFLQKQSVGDKSTKHWSAQLKEDLLQKGNRSLSEILNAPLQEMWYAWALIAETAGIIELANQAQEDGLKNYQQTGDNNLRIEGNWDDVVAAAKKSGRIFET
jgi:hypothetical protein